MMRRSPTRKLRKPALVWLSRAIEDECSARSPRPLLFAAFQHEHFYRQVESRWREFARTAERAIVLADFPDLRAPANAPVEVPLKPTDPLMREWVVACDAPDTEFVRPCNLCPHMKRITLAGIQRSLETMTVEVTVDPTVAAGARTAFAASAAEIAC